MEYSYYELNKAPDFSLNKYTSLSETGPAGVLTQHQAFWRQINQWGKLFGGVIHFIYEFNPQKKEGQRLKLVIRFDSPSIEAKISIQQIIKASVLAPYYEQLSETDEECLSNTCYPWQVNLFKKERFINSFVNENESFYTVSEWTMNGEARLYSLLKIMGVMNSACVYCVNIYPVEYENELKKGLAFILPHLRELNSFKVRTNSNSVSSGGRDENAKKALDFYEDLEDDIANSPHFLINIQAYAETEAEAKQLLDSAASEAVHTGTLSLYGEPFAGTIFDGMNQGFTSWSDPKAEDNLLFLPHLMTLEEMLPYAVFPVLYPGESIEMQKETVPPSQDGLFLGRDQLGHLVYFPWENLSKHAFLAGMPGSGKTNTMMHLVSEIYKAGIPVLVLEPAKKEYRTLTTLSGMENISLFSPCANSMFPIHINPFEFPIGMKLADHINRLLDVFNGTFQLDPPMPMLLTEGIQACYEELLWLPGMINSGNLEYPTMSMLYSKIEKLLDKYQYAEEVRSNLQSILQVRIGSLLSREMGDIFDVPTSTYRPTEWLKKSAIIELASLGTGPSNFLILMLMTLIRETLDVQVYEPKDDKKPRHIIFLEEAHNLIANTSVQMPGGLDPKVSATAYITKMLAEVRALGEGIVIADQLPTAMAPEVIKNTSLKFGLRLTSQDEREVLGSTMSADAVQIEKMGVFTKGHCLVSYEDLLRPFELQIDKFEGDDFIDDNKMILKSICNPNYHYNMFESAKIMRKKYENRRISLYTESNYLLKHLEKMYLKWPTSYDDLKAEKLDDFGYVASEPVGLILEDKRSTELRYKNLMEEWCRLTLDVLLYMGVAFVRDGKLKHIQCVYKKKCQIIKNAHEQCIYLFLDLYRTIQKNRSELKDKVIKYSLKELPGIEERLIEQQTLIKESWSTQID